jgi:hypothetical protein
MSGRKSVSAPTGPDALLSSSPRRSAGLLAGGDGTGSAAVAPPLTTQRSSGSLGEPVADPLRQLATPLLGPGSPTGSTVALNSPSVGAVGRGMTIPPPRLNTAGLSAAGRDSASRDGTPLGSGMTGSVMAVGSGPVGGFSGGHVSASPSAASSVGAHGRAYPQTTRAVHDREYRAGQAAPRPLSAQSAVAAAAAVVPAVPLPTRTTPPLSSQRPSRPAPALVPMRRCASDGPQ